MDPPCVDLPLTKLFIVNKHSNNSASSVNIGIYSLQFFSLESIDSKNLKLGMDKFSKENISF